MSAATDLVTGGPDLEVEGPPEPRRSRLEALRAPLPTVEQVFRPRSNAIGLLRLLFASLVIVSHSWPLGFGEANPLALWSHGQTDLGSLSVFGFFVLSGLLVTRSRRRSSFGRYVWHRALRILPAFWVCLLIMALVLGPALFLIRENTLSGYFALNPGPIAYLEADWFTAMRQYGIGDLLVNTPYGHRVGSVLNGSLWSLRYEIFCYALVAAIAVVGGMRKRPELTVAFAGATYGIVALDWTGHQPFGGGQSAIPSLTLPLIGYLAGPTLVPLALMFAIGMVAAVRPESFPMSNRLGVIALVVFLLSMRFGYFDVAGAPAFAYLVLWAAMRLPERMHAVGTKRDFSYGIYIYAFPIQQVLAQYHLQRAGRVPFILISLVLAVAAGACSWYLVEKPALRFKNASLPLRRAVSSALLGRRPFSRSVG